MEHAGSTPNLSRPQEDEEQQYITNRKRKFPDDSFVAQLTEFSNRILAKLGELDSRITTQNESINSLTLDMGKVMIQNEKIEKINEATKN